MNLKIFAVVLAVLAAFTPCLAQPQGFIRVEGTKFVDEACNDFTFVGANTWRMIEAAANTTGLQLDGLNPAEWLMQTAAANNITVLRMFATGVTDEMPLLLGPGKYNQVALEALDQLVAMASSYGIRLTLVLVRTWNAPDNLASFSSWTGTPIDQFFTDPKAIDALLNHITFMANRTNSVTGVVYKEDPFILSWNLMNEPRFFGNDTECSNDPKKCQDDFQNWVDVVSSHLKATVGKQLVTIGYEGFFGSDSQYQSANPAGDWALKVGHAFERNFALPSLDYTEIHYWPDNWAITTQDSSSFLNNWVDAHINATKALNKPLVFEEFGKNSTNPFNDPDPDRRKKYFSEVFDRFDASLKTDDALRGVAYWMWDPLIQNENSPGFVGFGQDQVPTDSPIFTDVIVPAARAAAQHTGTATGCTPVAATSSQPEAEPQVAATIGGGSRKLLNVE